MLSIGVTSSFNPATLAGIQTIFLQEQNVVFLACMQCASTIITDFSNRETGSRPSNCPLGQGIDVFRALLSNIFSVSPAIGGKKSYLYGSSDCISQSICQIWTAESVWEPLLNLRKLVFNQSASYSITFCSPFLSTYVFFSIFVPLSLPFVLCLPTKSSFSSKRKLCSPFSSSPTLIHSFERWNSFSFLSLSYCLSFSPICTV